MSAEIMVVDDDPGLLTLLEIMLRPRGFKVLKASDAILALTTLRSTTPRLIILDVMMPEINGIELCRLIRQRPETEGTPVLMLSVRHDPPTIEAAYEAGATDYLMKPILRHDLLLKIDSWLEDVGEQ